MTRCPRLSPALLALLALLTFCQREGETEALPTPAPFPEASPARSFEDPYYTEEVGVPLVKILSPAHEEIVENPVIITVSAFNIHHFALYDSGVLIRKEMVPLELTDIHWTMLQPGLPHTLELFGYDDEGREVAYASTRVIPLPDLDLSRGNLVGSLWISYYYVSREQDFRLNADILLRDSACLPLATVDYQYMSEVCVEGSGQLLDGTVINYASGCDCAVPCPYGGGKICYTELDQERYPWGAGAASASLIPLRSLAVDNNVIPHGTLIYMEEWDGVYIPPVDGVGNFIHDGCFVASDVGGWIKNDHFDFFSGTHRMWLALERIAPTRSRFTVYTDAGRCSWLGEELRRQKEHYKRQTSPKDTLPATELATSPPQN